MIDTPTTNLTPLLTRPGRWRDPATLQTAAYAVVIVAGGWWMLGQLAAVLRPLLIAVFLCYVLLPYYSRLRRSGVPTPVALVLLVSGAVGVLGAIILLVYASLLGLAEDAPALKERAIALSQGLHNFLNVNVPWIFTQKSEGSKSFEEQIAEQLPGHIGTMVNVALGGLIELAVAGLYLLFLLLGAEKLPTKVRNAYPDDEASKILHIAGRINSAIISYLKAKVLSSLIFAIPVGLVLTVCGVKFAIMWAVLTFVCNFVPYIGSVVAYVLPIAFALLQLGFGAPVIVAAILVLAVHIVCATLIEPMLIGRAVGLSPLIVLGALAVWGLVWGLPGMVLAVPLAVMAKIVLENIKITRSFAKMVEE